MILMIHTTTTTTTTTSTNDDNNDDDNNDDDDNNNDNDSNRRAASPQRASAAHGRQASSMREAANGLAQCSGDEFKVHCATLKQGMKQLAEADAPLLAESLVS